MQQLTLDINLVNFILVAMAVLLFAQAYVLLRIRNILQAIAMNFDSIIYFCRKFAGNANQQNKVKDTVPKTCQFCKHRLAYINTGKADNSEEDFYHRCGLRNINIALNDSCKQYEADEHVQS